ncbi:MAG TPA: LysM peptidoglycan-binding domain-containing protein [Actinoplanes sp.]|nr:LysM peptidoglycan-binding domain-containing protein [Actinoplanes sp.]
MEDEQVSEQARQRAAQYARQPSLWAAPPATATRPSPTRRPTLLLRTVVTAAVLLGGPPWVLWMAFGNPVTVWSSWWSTGPFTTATTVSPAAGLRVVSIWAGWLVWVVLAALLAGSVAGALRGRRLPRWHLPMPLHRLVVGLTGTATVALVTTPATAALAAPPAHAVPAAQPSASGPETQHRPPAPPSTPARADASGVHASGDLVTVSVEDARYDYRVRRGDTLSKIAETWLNDQNRWPEICSLNKHRHFTGGRTLTDCDLIYPGWSLRLPADAVAPPDAAPRRPRTPHPAAPDQPVPSGPSATSPPPAPRSPEAASPTGPATPKAGTPEDEGSHETTGGDLVLPSGSVIPWALATAIAATAALVWLQRRRRYQPGSDDDLHELPAPVLAAQHHTRQAITPTPVEPAPAERLPSGGVGLIGPGADAAARGLIITALTTGTPTEAAQRAEVIIDRPTLTALIGDTSLAGWSRLHITDDLDQALALLDTHLLRRARILDEHGLDDIDALRDTAPSEQALPPLLLITRAEQAANGNRARITFGLTEGLDVITVVLGHWPHGSTVSVSDDGDTQLEPGGPEPGMQLAVLDVAATRDLLDTVREAHTGEATATSRATHAQPAVHETGDPAAPTSLHASRTDTAATPPLHTPQRARLRVLGKPRIENITADGRPLRAKALELAVFLAVHPDGASTREIGEYLEPDARISQADQRIHTNASNLRHVLGRAGTAETKNTYVIKTAGRYRLDPETVDIDVWTLRDLMRTATIATEPHRRELLTAACDLCSAPLAEGQDYEWIQPHRETVRRWGTEAHLMLAEDLLDSDPQAASDLLDKAIGMDRYNEALYVKAMHARHALADADGIRTLLRALTKALADLDAEPREDTLELANTLRTSLDKT